MSNLISPDPLKTAWNALASFDYGSSRGDLVALDDAVARCSIPRGEGKQLERKFLALLGQARSVPARTYICSKLAQIGSARSVPALAGLLRDPDLGNAARDALEVIPSPKATRALCAAIPQLTGPARIGAINSLGNRRDTAAVATLSPLLPHQEMEVAGAAAAALGAIAGAKAARALSVFLPKAPVVLRPMVADALLACAEQAARDRKPAEAQAICRLLDQAPNLPDYFKTATKQLSSPRH